MAVRTGEHVRAKAAVDQSSYLFIFSGQLKQGLVACFAFPQAGLDLTYVGWVEDPRDMHPPAVSQACDGAARSSIGEEANNRRLVFWPDRCHLKRGCPAV